VRSFNPIPSTLNSQSAGKILSHRRYLNKVLDRLDGSLYSSAMVMNPLNVENIIVDEARELTYVVMASRRLTDGEAYRDIRLALLKRGGKHPPRGERFVITSSNL